MLGKLLKYELQSTARFFLPLYPALILLAVLNKVMFALFDGSSSFAIPQSVAMMVYIFMIIAVFVITLIVTIQRFYKNLIGNEGYLMHTLPVSTHSLILSKLIVAIMWEICSVIVTAISILIQISDYGLLKNFFIGLRGLSQMFKTEFEMSLTGVLFGVITVAIVAVIFVTLIIYCAMALGNLANRNKIMVSFAAYLGIITVAQIVGTVFMYIAGNSFFGATLSSAAVSNAEIAHYFVGCIIIGLVLYTILSVGVYFLTQYILSKKLNLE